MCLLLKDALAIATYHWCTYLEWFHLHICQVGWLCLWEVRLTNWNRLIDLTHRIAQKYLDSWLAPTSLTQELVSLHLVLILACHSFALLSVELILARQRLYPLVTHLQRVVLHIADGCTGNHNITFSHHLIELWQLWAIPSRNNITDHETRRRSCLIPDKWRTGHIDSFQVGALRQVTSMATQKDANVSTDDVVFSLAHSCDASLWCVVDIRNRGSIVVVCVGPEVLDTTRALVLFAVIVIVLQEILRCIGSNLVCLVKLYCSPDWTWWLWWVLSAVTRPLIDDLCTDSAVLVHLRRWLRHVDYCLVAATYKVRLLSWCSSWRVLWAWLSLFEVGLSRNLRLWLLKSRVWASFSTSRLSFTETIMSMLLTIGPDNIEKAGLAVYKLDSLCVVVDRIVLCSWVDWWADRYWQRLASLTLSSHSKGHCIVFAFRSRCFDYSLDWDVHDFLIVASWSIEAKHWANNLRVFWNGRWKFLSELILNLRRCSKAKVSLMCQIECNICTMSLNFSIWWDTTENFLELHVACQMLHQVRPQLIINDFLMSSCVSLSGQIFTKLGQHVRLYVLH